MEIDTADECRTERVEHGEADRQRERNLEAMEMMARDGQAQDGGQRHPQSCQTCAWRDQRMAPRLYEHLGALAQAADESMRAGLSCRSGGNWEAAAERFAEAERGYSALAQLAGWERLNAARLPMEQRVREERERMLAARHGGDDGIPFI